MVNLFQHIPYESTGLGKRFLLDTDHLKLIQVALHPGQEVPHHHTNGDVHILMLQGEIIFILNGMEMIATQGMLIPMGYDTPMQARNASEGDATFLIIKTPAIHTKA